MTFVTKVVVHILKAFCPSLPETIIKNDKIGIIIWSDKPLGIIIHQKEAAESYDKFFEIMWKAGRH